MRQRFLVPASTPQLNRFLGLATICLVVAALYLAQEVIEPVVLAMLFSFLLTPATRRLERTGLHRVPACLLVVCLALFLVGLLVWSVTSHAVDLAQDLPQYRDNIVHKLSHTPLLHGTALTQVVNTLNDFGAQIASTTNSSTTQPVPVVISQQSGGYLYFAHSFLNLLAAPAGMTLVVVILVIFMLLRREDLRDRLIRLIGEGRLDVTTEALAEAGERISRYLTMQSAVNFAYGIAIGSGLWIIGHVSAKPFPNAALWGLLCGLLRFVPYLGPWMGAVCPVLLSIAVYPGNGQLLATGCLFAGIELLNNSAFEPLLYGSSTGLSALAILIAALFWTWLWGPIGLLLSTPLTACIVVIGKYVPQMEFLDVLLGDEPALSPAMRLYQRLLATNTAEAKELTLASARSMPLEQLYDSVFLPALAKAERDAIHGGVDGDRLNAIRQGFRDLIEQTAQQEIADLEKDAVAQPASNDAGTPHRPRLPHDCSLNVLLLPANDEADELCALMLGKLLELRGYCTIPLGAATLASEMVEAVETKSIQIIVISALPPGAVNHSTYLTKRLRARFTDIPIVSGVWTFKSDQRRLRQRIDASPNTTYATDFKNALEQIHQFAQRPMTPASA